MRDGSAGERAMALATYRILHSYVDPRGTLGCDRVEWALDALKVIDLRFEPLFRQAGTCAERSIVRQRANVALGAFLVSVERFDEGEQLFLAVLAEARGRGTIPERAACLNLARLYVRQWRVFEGYLLAQHATRLFRAANDPLRELHAMDEALGCLSEMREWTAFDELMTRAEHLLAHLPAHSGSEFTLVARKIFAALQRGHADEALRMLDALAPPIDDHVFTVCHTWWRHSTRGAVLTELGELEEGARLLQLARGTIDPGTAAWVTLLARQARCAALRGDDELLVANAHEMLAPSHDDFVARLGSGHAIELAVTLANALQSRGHSALARAAFDRAALCAVARVRETDRVVREIPELAFVTHADRALLSGVLRRFGSQQRDLLTSLATLFERAHAAGESWLTDLRTGTQVVICAWCTQVRSAAGHWVPIGHYVPEETLLPLSHGACDACMSDLRSTYAV